MSRDVQLNIKLVEGWFSRIKLYTTLYSTIDTVHKQPRQVEIEIGISRLNSNSSKLPVRATRVLILDFIYYQPLYIVINYKIYRIVNKYIINFLITRII